MVRAAIIVELQEHHARADAVHLVPERCDGEAYPGVLVVGKENDPQEEEKVGVPLRAADEPRPPLEVRAAMVDELQGKQAATVDVVPERSGGEA